MAKHLTESVAGTITATHEFTTGTCKVSDAGSFKTNVISEYTTASGVTIDSVLLKDDGVGATYVLDPSNSTTLIKICTDLATDITAGVTNLAVFGALTTGTTITCGTTQYLHIYGDGCITITAGTTLTVGSPGNIVTAPHKQVVAGTGLLRFTKPGDMEVGWWGTKGDCTVLGAGTNDATAIQAAIDCARASYVTTTGFTAGPTLHFEPKIYLVTASLFAGRNSTTSSKWLYRIDGHNATLYGKHTGHILDYTGAHGKFIDNLQFYGDSTTKPSSGLFLSRKDASSSAGRTTMNKCRWAGYYSIASIVNYQSEVSLLNDSDIQQEDGVACIIFTDTGYYKNAAGTWVILVAPNADTWPGAVTNIMHHIKRSNIQHKASEGATYVAHIQATGVSLFTISECNIACEDDVNDIYAKYIQFNYDDTALHGGGAVADVTITKNLFHSVFRSAVEFTCACSGFIMTGNKYGGQVTEAYLDYTSGSEAPVYGDTIVGATSGAVADVVYVPDPTTGTWLGGTAAGKIYIHKQYGTFVSENINISGGTSNVMTIATDSVAWGACIYSVGTVTLTNAEIVANSINFSSGTSQIVGNNILRIGDENTYGFLNVASRLDGDVFLRPYCKLTKSSSDALANARIIWSDYGLGYLLSHYRELTVGTCGSTTNEITLQTITIPAGQLCAGSDIKILAGGDVDGTNTHTIVLYFTDGTTSTSYTMNNKALIDTSTWLMDVTLMVSSNTIQIGSGMFTVSTTGTTSYPVITWVDGYMTPGVDLTKAVSIYLTGTCGDTGCTIRQRSMRVVGLH